MSTALDRGNFMAPCSCAVKKCGCETEKLVSKDTTRITFNVNSDKISETPAEIKGIYMGLYVNVYKFY